MPIFITEVAGGASYASPFVGPVDHPAHVKLDISGMTDDEIDANGYIKPGVPLRESGVLIGSGNPVFGVVIEATKVAADNASGTLAAATDVFVAVATIGQVNQDIIEDNLGRALTADEIAGFNLAGSKLTLLPT
jgi:hypothetical protein